MHPILQFIKEKPLVSVIRAAVLGLVLYLLTLVPELIADNYKEPAFLRLLNVPLLLICIVSGTLLATSVLEGTERAARYTLIIFLVSSAMWYQVAMRYQVAKFEARLVQKDKAISLKIIPKIPLNIIPESKEIVDE